MDHKRENEGEGGATSGEKACLGWKTAAASGGAFPSLHRQEEKHAEQRLAVNGLLTRGQPYASLQRFLYPPNECQISSSPLIIMNPHRSVPVQMNCWQSPAQIRTDVAPPRSSLGPI